MRISLALIVIILMLFGPYDGFYVEMSPWLFKARFPNLGDYFWVLKWSVLALAITTLFNIYRFWLRPLFALTFLAFNYYVTCFGTSYWITNTHLNIFALLLCFEDEKQKDRSSWIIAFMTTYVAVLYFQAGLSKVLLGGWEWFWEGKRIWTETLLLGTPFGKWLTQWPFIFRVMGIGTAFFELVVPFLFFSRKTDRIAAAIAIGFHLMTFLVMGISFWFLWALYPALFFVRKERYYQYSNLW